MKQKALTFIMSAFISLMLGSIGFMFSGCQTNEQIQVIQPQANVTNYVPTTAFNDEKYVWENFYFSTNRVNDAKK